METTTGKIYYRGAKDTIPQKCRLGYFQIIKWAEYASMFKSGITLDIGDMQHLTASGNEIIITLYICDENRFKAFEPLIVRYTTLDPDAQTFFAFQRYEIQSNMLGTLEISWLNEPANQTLLSFYLTCCPMNLLEFITKVQTIQQCCKIHLRLELMILEMGFCILVR